MYVGLHGMKKSWYNLEYIKRYFWKFEEIQELFSKWIKHKHGRRDCVKKNWEGVLYYVFCFLFLPTKQNHILSRKEERERGREGEGEWESEGEGEGEGEKGAEAKALWGIGAAQAKQVWWPKFMVVHEI